MGLNKKIRRQIEQMPKYKIHPEAFETQNILRARAFGRDRDIEMAQEDIDQGVAGATQEAKDITSSTSALLDFMTGIDTRGFFAKRDLAKEEANLRRGKFSEFYQGQQMMIDEKDKAWRQNVHAPWDAKYRDLQRRQANRRAFWNNLIGGLLTAAGTVAGAAAGGPAGAAVGAKIGSSFKTKKSTSSNEGYDDYQYDDEMYQRNPLPYYGGFSGG